MLNELGYHRPSYDELLEDAVQLAKNLFGEDIETSEQTPLGKFIRIIVYSLADSYQDLENIYYARFPNTATGISLDRLCIFAGISRNPATYAEYQATVTGDAGTEVYELIVCGENPEIVFHNVEPFMIGEDGTALVTFQCDTLGGAGNSITINEIVNPVANVSSVGDSMQTQVADEVESDYDLRRRFSQALEGDGGSSLKAIRASVLQVPSIKSVSIVENATNDYDEEGRPPHSFETYVYGGEDQGQAIAEAIFDVKPAGIQTVGDEAVTVIDASGNNQVINFSYATNIYVNVHVVIRIDDEFPANGEAQIQANIADRINGLDLGDSLILSTLYGCAYRVGGVPEVTVLEVSTDGGETYSSNNVILSDFEIAICSGVTVEVEGNG